MSESNETNSKTNSDGLAEKTKILRDTLDLLLNKSIEQRRICEELKQENKYLQDNIDNLMGMGDVLSKWWFVLCLFLVATYVNDVSMSELLH